VPAAAYFHQVGVAVEITGAHFRIGLKAARAGDHCLGAEVVPPVGRTDAHAFDAAKVAVHGADRRVETQLDVEAVGDPAPLRELAEAAAGHMYRDAALEIAFAVDVGVLLERLELDADFAH